ncbi:PoNe immunity protein domain-containing protein, partial [Gilliamella sp. Bif1-4]
FEAAAVAYLKDIDDSCLHRFIYYPKDMVEYARNNRQ